MLKDLFRQIAFLGINENDLDNVSHIKIVNTISLMVLTFLIIQLPFIIGFWQYGGSPVLISCALHIVVFIQILRFNWRHHFVSARSLLMCGFVSYIGISSIIWSINLQFHFFFLIGLFVSPFLYRDWETRQYIPNLIIYVACFCGIEAYWQFPRHAFQPNELERFWLTMGTCLLISGAAITASLLVYQNTRRAHVRVTRDKARISHLLQKTLPKPLIKTLLTNFTTNQSSTQLEQHSCSVLFADIQGYTQHCSHSNTQETMQLLNAFYCEFDLISRRNQLQKIKTNGDQYMAVCGIYEKRINPAIQSCQAAKAMLKSFNHLCGELNLNLQIRIGIASGPLTAGCVGLDNMLFDVWGETVNLASRLESNGKASKILVCHTTYLHSRSHIKFESGDKLNLKGLGTLTAYFISDTE
ncbi:adenylate/guanylate cyclase domain-containing protein [Aliiglaciecola sp. 3_MG-2023]|uniref:adenylate/guanylate cyclase domain-containing protein n=1 Tax=Aliiglaciecola sp. 3_MG-2023 TaxID=3062644 RepID=UPI0026E296D7|nr:adenylate/guanylate cyclase domain-containing protein [Aliiglaciecola sp. 3_MG-2023]MDO6693588.1 adenylate/guanylate cyclase domain-containing protein [Aliiglaciecola sp. 3_MG-2023]